VFRDQPVSKTEPGRDAVHDRASALARFGVPAEVVAVDDPCLADPVVRPDVFDGDPDAALPLADHPPHAVEAGLPANFERDVVKPHAVVSIATGHRLGVVTLQGRVQPLDQQSIRMDSHGLAPTSITAQRSVWNTRRDMHVKGW
jgi:hypothetical protein